MKHSILARLLKVEAERLDLSQIKMRVKAIPQMTLSETVCRMHTPTPSSRGVHYSIILLLQCLRVAVGSLRAVNRHPPAAAWRSSSFACTPSTSSSGTTSPVFTVEKIPANGRCQRWSHTCRPGLFQQDKHIWITLRGRRTYHSSTTT